MKALSYFVIIFLFLENHLIHAQSLTENNNKLLIDAGCKEKQYANQWNLTTQRYERIFAGWQQSGILLSRGACIPKGYTSLVVPEKGLTKVFSTIENEQVRAVDANDGTVSVDFTLTMRWLDPNIRTNFSMEDGENGGIILDNRYKDLIWKPNLYIFNLSSFKTEDEWLSMNTLALLTTNEINDIENNKNSSNNGSTIEIPISSKTTVEYSVEIKSTVYCDFDHSRYPMDEQTCNLTLRSRHFGPIFTLYDPENVYHKKHNYISDNFDMSISFFDMNLKTGHNTIGINIRMDREVDEFILKYYIPCIAIVLVSGISFVIPITAIPGRVALLVTQFLTLTNLFMHQMTESPSDSGLDALGLYLLCSLVFVFGALIEFAIVVILDRSTRALDNKRTGTDNSMKTNKFNDNLKRQMKLLGLDPAVYGEPPAPDNQARRYVFGVPRAFVVDVISFWAFLLLYILFNIIYWMKYLN